MRIIAGACKGRTLKTPKGLNTRPTLDRTRETMFNVLQNYGIVQRDVLDLFAGTGALGLEALSRGAKSLTAMDARTGSLLKDNVAICRMEEKVIVIQKSIGPGCSSLEGKKFDLVFSDPPYEKGYMQVTIDQLTKFQLVRNDGLVVLECHKNDTFIVPEFWTLLKEQLLGYTKIYYYRVATDGEEPEI